MEKLKPCPWCGQKKGYKITQYAYGKGNDWAIKCDKCGATGPYADSVKGAQRKWNKRRSPLP